MSERCKGRVERRYDFWSKYYDALDTFPIVGRIEKKWRLEALEKLDIKKDSKVLDMGCGSGLMLPWMAERISDGEIIAIDFSAKMLDVASRRVMKAGLEDKVTVLRENVEGTQFPDEHFDRILATFTVTSVPNPQRLVREMERLLKKDGRAVILDAGKPTSRLMIIYPLCKWIAKIGGYTYWDRDIIGMVNEETELRTVDIHRYFGGMVYLMVLEKKGNVG